MARLPTTARGKIYALIFLAAAIPFTVWTAISLSGPVVWITIALVTIAVIAVIFRRRRLNAAREHAYIGAFSFGDVNRRLHAEEALAEVSARAHAREAASPTHA